MLRSRGDYEGILFYLGRTLLEFGVNLMQIIGDVEEDL
jgi:hypothetical protein